MNLPAWWRGREARQVERVFTDIYRRRSWGGEESASGPGSTRTRAADFLGPLVAEVRRLDAAALLDAPCGDFNWAAPLADAVPRYIGVDVVGALVDTNRRLHGSLRRSFLRRDLIRDRLPACDVVFCRDGLVHLSFADLWRALANFRRTGARYLIATTFTGERTNADVETGGWRPLNLERPPFGFPAPFALVDEQCHHSARAFDDKALAFWRFDRLPQAPAPP